MSKRDSLGGTPNNTLLRYFTKSPAVSAKKTPNTRESPVSKGKKHEEDKCSPTEDTTLNNNVDKKPAKRQLDTELSDSSSEKDVIVSKKKRRRIIQSGSDDSDSETEMDKKTDYKRSINAQVDSDDSSHDDGKSEKKKIKSTNGERMSKKKTLDAVNISSDNKKENSSLVEKLQKLQNSEKSCSNSDSFKSKCEDIVCTTSTLDEPVVWPHNKLEFLKPDKIKDKKGRRPEHPDYDRATLHVPDSFLNTLTPGVRQWWVLKSDNYDCILFFKVGKFYELYHMDADVGVKELGFTYMRGEFAHSGFPEVSFDKMATILVDRGYKVARVEQTETPDMMTERCKKQSKVTKFDKVVRREICQIINRGTQVFGSQCQITPNHQPNYMLSVVEKNNGITSRYGICFIDTSIGDFFIGEFDDDKNCSRLLTLLSHHMPVLVVAEKTYLSPRTQEIFRTILGGVLKEYLHSSANKVCSAEKTLKHLAENYYSKSSEDNWPLTIRSMQNESDHLGLTPSDSFKLALNALGCCISYLNRCHLEEKVLPMARYNLYIPPDMFGDSVDGATLTPTAAASSYSKMRSHMVLDSITLSNLRINAEDHSLLSTLDNCCTKFGKRLLHHWVCSPSCDISVITERQKAISDLMQNDQVLQDARALIAPLPDFERHLAQIHLFGNKQVVDSHPDGRAILFEEKIYNKKKIQNFISILQGFKTLTKIPELFTDCKSKLIQRITQLPAEGGIFPNITKELQFFKNAFDHEEAAKTGVIAPEKGVDTEYDNAEEKIEQINTQLKEYLIQQEKFFGCRLNYFGTDKKRFQLEVPESNARKAGNQYFLEGQKKGAKPVRRFHTNETKNFLKLMQQAEDERNRVLKDLSRRIFEKFSKHYTLWKQCVDCVANLDVLGSLAEYARNQNSICIPELQPAVDGEPPFIEIDEGYHPCVSPDSYIPNGLILGASGTAPLAILTGPNMGGKSTLMRQVGLIVIMAQIGSHVPANSCKLSIVDRIFTRLGAQDDILAGHSTFLVELNETSLILRHATVNSLVLLDELGRGTATYDGTAIAASVVNFLANLKCRTLFSTHYHNLIDFFHKDDRVVLGHMACMVENEDNDDPTQETVTFLYKYTSGACPKSYGFNAAKLAGMPRPIIKRAYELSKKVEAIALKRKIASKIIANPADISAVKNLLVQLKSCKII